MADPDPAGRAVRVALLGTGASARELHLPAIRALAGEAELVAAMDIDQARVRAFCATHGIPRAYTSLERMLAQATPDVVLIASPPTAHASQAIACLEAGAHVLCEKPLATSLAELDEIAAAEARSEARVGGILQWRSGPGVAEVRRLIASGDLGRPLLALGLTTWYRGRVYYETPWRGSWHGAGGGPALTLGIHALDLLLHLLGEWQEIRGVVRTLDRPIETDDVSLALVELESGALLSLVNSVVSPREESYLRIDLALATVELRHLYRFEARDWTITPASDLDDPGAVLAGRDALARAGGGSALTAQIARTIEAFRAGTPPPVGLAEARRAIELITALYKSARTDRPVRRGSIAPDDPYARGLHGGDPRGAP